jgi:hypothetical protein
VPGQKHRVDTHVAAGIDDPLGPGDKMANNGKLRGLWFAADLSTMVGRQEGLLHPCRE